MIFLYDSCLFGFALSIFFLVMHISRLLSGGIWLITEREGDAVILEASIEAIEPLGREYSDKFELENPYEDANRYRFTIAGVICMGNQFMAEKISAQKETL